MDISRTPLDQDQRRDLEGLVRRACVKNWGLVFRQLSRQVENSLGAWSSATNGSPTPHEISQLRRLTMLVLEPDPSLFQVRKWTSELPASQIAAIQARALQKAQRNSAFDLMAKDLRTWVKSAKANDLVALLRSCLIEGGKRIPGRIRPGGRRSAHRFEPLILGKGRGLSGVEKTRGGRRADDDLQLLISFLAVDWLQSTGLQPDKGRSDHTPFGALVFMVFRWIGVEGKASHSLRSFWSPRIPRATVKRKGTATLSQG
jgi:hypothetical protein